MSTNKEQRRADMRKHLETRIQGVKVSEILNPDTSRPFTDQELDDFITSGRERELLSGGSGVRLKPIGPP